MVRFTTSLVTSCRSGLPARWIMGLLLAVAGAVFGAIGPPANRACRSNPDTACAVSPERLPAELAKVKQGLMTPIPQADLDAKVAQAAKAQAGAKVKPHLAQANYAAELSGPDLSSGTGTWMVHHQCCPRSAFADWSQSRLEQM